ncbi:MAG: YeiH family protein [Erysipelotrichaceae bacterium]
MNKIKKIAPGFLVSLLIACLSVCIESVLPIHMIGASVIALFLGILCNHFFNTSKMVDGLKFTSKRILKFAIILLGASLSITTILTVGKFSLAVMCFTLLTCFGGGYFVGKALKLNWKVSNLISAGTGICGGSAIAAIAPVIEAEDSDIAFAMSATFLFDMVMILVFPLMGQALGLNDMAFGLWAGTAVNDTSSVVATGYAFSQGAGDFAVMVKLTRALSIIPVVLIFAFIQMRIKRKEALSQDVEMNKVSVKSSFPWFIGGFIFMAILNSFGFIPATLSVTLKEISKFLMVAALGAIGLNTSFDHMKNNGRNPMIHGFIISLLVVIVAYLVIMGMNQFVEGFTAFI